MMTDSNKKSSRKSAHNAKVRARIASEAARAFRIRGYNGIGLNDLMASAGLTRGAFYAHFKSKEALFEHVILEQYPLLSHLQARKGNDAAALWAGCMAVFSAYLKPETLAETSQACTLAALTQDAARLSEPVRRAYEAAHRRILKEMARSQSFQADHPLLLAGLMLANGAVASAAASASAPRKRLLLMSAHDALTALWRPLTPALAKPGHAV